MAIFIIWRHGISIKSLTIIWLLVLDTARRLGLVTIKGLSPPCRTGLTLQSLDGRRSIGVICAIAAMLISERVRCSYRTPRTDCPFRAHSNLWWARHGWPLIHPVSRLDGQFSRPPYFPAGVNLTAELSSEPPRGGEHGAGENCLYRKRSFAESRNG